MAPQIYNFLSVPATTRHTRISPIVTNTEKKNKNLRAPLRSPSLCVQISRKGAKTAKKNNPLRPCVPTLSMENSQKITFASFAPLRDTTHHARISRQDTKSCVEDAQRVKPHNKRSGL